MVQGETYMSVAYVKQITQAFASIKRITTSQCVNDQEMRFNRIFRVCCSGFTSLYLQNKLVLRKNVLVGLFGYLPFNQHQFTNNLTRSRDDKVDPFEFLFQVSNDKLGRRCKRLLPG